MNEMLTGFANVMAVEEFFLLIAITFKKIKVVDV
jgi:hypothetical protein